jgi:hypothetical protein
MEASFANNITKAIISLFSIVSGARHANGLARSAYFDVVFSLKDGNPLRRIRWWRLRCCSDFGNTSIVIQKDESNTMLWLAVEFTDKIVVPSARHVYNVNLIGKPLIAKRLGVI